MEQLVFVYGFFWPVNDILVSHMQEMILYTCKQVGYL